jgi:hypothetical protein
MIGAGPDQYSPVRRDSPAVLLDGQEWKDGLGPLAATSVQTEKGWPPNPIDEGGQPISRTRPARMKQAPGVGAARPKAIGLGLPRLS